MPTSRVGRVGAALLVLALAAGCAGRWAYRQGQDARDRGDWDLAVARYMRALEKDPDNITYKIALENAKVQASRLHYDQARKHIAASDFARAAEELEIATKYDPANRSASDDLLIVRQRLRRQEDERRDRDDFEARRARAQVKLPVPFLSPRKADPITLNFKDTSLQKVFETLGKLADVNVIFDEGFRDKPRVDVNLRGLTFEQALDRLTLVNRLFYKVLDQNTIIVVPESRQKRVAYDELVLRTFYVQNAEVADTANLIKTLAKVNTVMANASLGAITIVGTPEQLAMAERIIDANDKARGEVLVEVQILEVDRNKAKNWGLQLSNYSLGATLAPFNDPGTGEDAGTTLNLRAHLLSSLNQADWVISLPSSIFTQFIASDATVRILAAPRLRAAEGKPAELKIGQEVPIPQTSFSLGISTGTTGYLPATSFTYKNVGVNLKLTPRVSASGDVAMELAAEFSLLGGDRNVGTVDNALLVPTFLTRTVTGTLRLRDGETGLIGGLLQSSETTNFAGALGMDNIPVLGKLLGNRSRAKDETEVIMSITPRIVRGPKVTEDDMIPLSVGTEEVRRVPGARPGLFGPVPAQGSELVRPAPSQAPGVPTPGAVVPPAPSGAAVPLPSAPAQPPLPETTPQARPELTPQTTQAPETAAPGASPGAPAAATPAAPVDARPVSVMVSPPDVSLRAGQSAGFAVLLVGARDVQWVEASLVFDPTLVEVAETSPGALITLDGATLQAERQVEGGRARVRFARAAPVSGSGAVVAVTLRGLKAGSGVVAVESLVIGQGGGTTANVTVPAPARVVVAP